MKTHELLELENTIFFRIIRSMKGEKLEGEGEGACWCFIVELTLTPNAAIFSMHSTVNIPVKHMFMYFSVFLYASLCRWNCNAWHWQTHGPRETDKRASNKPINFPRVSRRKFTLPPIPSSPLSSLFHSSRGKRARIGERRGRPLIERTVHHRRIFASFFPSFSFRLINSGGAGELIFH